VECRTSLVSGFSSKSLASLKGTSRVIGKEFPHQLHFQLTLEPKASNTVFELSVWISALLQIGQTSTNFSLTIKNVIKIKI